MTSAHTIQFPNETNHYMFYFDDNGIFNYTPDDITLEMATKFALVT
jgi:hypothetical protein